MTTQPSDSIVNFLERWEWYQTLPHDLRELTVRTSSEQFAEPGEYIAREGMPCTHWYGLLKGYLQMYVVGTDGAETTLYCLREGEWGGDGSLLKNEMRRYDLRALTSTHICRIPVQTFNTLRNESIAFNHYLTDIMNARMGAFVTMLVASRLLKPEVRVARGLLMVAKDRQDGFQALDVSQHELSLICGLSRQRVNVALGDFKRLGFVNIEPNKGMLFVDAQKLNTFVLTEGAARS